MARISRNSRQKSAKNTAYSEKNHEKHGKNTASKYHVLYEVEALWWVQRSGFRRPLDKQRVPGWLSIDFIIV